MGASTAAQTRERAGRVRAIGRLYQRCFPVPRLRVNQCALDPNSQMARLVARQAARRSFGWHRGTVRSMGNWSCAGPPAHPGDRVTFGAHILGGSCSTKLAIAPLVRVPLC